MLDTKVFTAVTSVFIFWAATDVVQCKYIYHEEVSRWVQQDKVVATWEQAKIHCEREGAVLASPINEELLQYMTSLFDFNHHDTPYFIGMKLIQNTEIFSSIEGALLDDLPESVINRIDKLDPREGDCLGMSSSNIHVVPCWARLPYLCFLNTTTSSTVFEPMTTPSSQTETQSTTIWTSTKSPTTTPASTRDTTYKGTNCGFGYEFYLAGSCYKVHDEYTSWDEAQSTCSSEGGYLAVINDANEARYLETINSRPNDEYLRKWIGLRKIDGDWRSINGDSLEQIFNVWSNSVSGRECGALNFNDGLLDDQRCTFNYRFICEKRVQTSIPRQTTERLPTTETVVTTPSATLFGSGYHLYSTGSLYKVHYNPLPWAAANATCAREGGYLAVVNDAEEANLLAVLGISEPHVVWTGLHKTNGDWYSVQGDYIEDIYNRWSVNRADATCGVLIYTTLLDDGFCDYPFQFICEKNIDD